MSSSRIDEYRAIAERALRLADQAETPNARQTFLHMAARWHALAEHFDDLRPHDAPPQEATRDPREQRR